MDDKLYIDRGECIMKYLLILLGMITIVTMLLFIYSSLVLAKVSDEGNEHHKLTK